MLGNGLVVGVRGGVVEGMGEGMGEVEVEVDDRGWFTALPSSLIGENGMGGE